MLDLLKLRNWPGWNVDADVPAGRAGPRWHRIPLNAPPAFPVETRVLRPFHPAFWLAFVAVASAALQAQPLPFARLNWVHPSVVRAGESVEVNIQGADLEDPNGLVFSVPGATVQSTGGTTFRIQFPAGTPPSMGDVRFSGRFGLSNPRAFEVTDLPVVTIPATNTAVASAFPVALNTAIVARSSANALDHYGINLPRGQRVVVRVLARELDSKLEPVISVFTDAGKELGRARRSFLDFTAPDAGRYVVKVHDALFRGGEDSFYRLVVSTAPHVDFALPNVLRAGQTNRVLLCGRNLPGGKPSKRTGVDGQVLEELDVDVVAPANPDPTVLLPRRSSAVLDVFSWAYRATNGWSNPLLFSLSDHPGLAGPLTPGATAVTVPVEYTGQFMARGALSGVQFSARKGEGFWVDVFADRLGLHADATGIVQRQTEGKDAQGNPEWTDVFELPELDSNAGERDFNTSSRDCAGRFEAPSDGTYRVWVRDLYNLGKLSPHHWYHLRVRRDEPDFRLAAVAVQPPRPKDDNREVHPVSTVLRRGGVVPVRVMAFRRGGFNGDIELAATALPKGVRSASGRILAGQNSGLLFLAAADDAPAGAGLIRVVGTARAGTNTLERTARAGAVSWHLPDWDQASVSSRTASGYALAVMDSELAPVTLAVTAPAEAVAGGKLTIPVTVARRGEYPAAFNLKPFGRPELDKAKDTAVAEKGTNATVEINLAELKLPEGTHWIWLQGQCAGKYRKMPESADAAEKALKDAEKAAGDAAAAAKKAADELAALKSPTPEAKAAAEKAVAETSARVKTAEDKKKGATQVSKDATERAKPRDTVVPVYSAPFQVKITPAPKPPEKK